LHKNFDLVTPARKGGYSRNKTMFEIIGEI